MRPTFYIIAGALLSSAILHKVRANTLTQDEAEESLISINEYKHKFLNLSQNFNELENNYFIKSIRNRYYNILEVQKLLEGISTNIAAGKTCDQSDKQWPFSIFKIFELIGPTPRGRTENLSIERFGACGTLADEITAELRLGKLVPSKNLISGLLSTIKPRVATPDVITLLENVDKIIQQPKVNIPEFKVTNTEIIEDFLDNIFTENQLNDNENYQLLQLQSTLKTIQPISEIFELIKKDNYPEDVIKSRNVLKEALDLCQIEDELSTGWGSPPDQLMNLLTKWTALPNDGPFAVDIHVLYSHFRMNYLTIMGYKFIPKTSVDIAFLLNSFLNIRHPKVLQEVYTELNNIPWQEFIQGIDYSEYSNPRKLITDMISLILKHPEGLKVCNAILLKYFIETKDDSSCPHWIEGTFPLNETARRPIVVQPPPQNIDDEDNDDCNGRMVEIIDPDSLLEILDKASTVEIVNSALIKNPIPAVKSMKNTRGQILKSFLHGPQFEEYDHQTIDENFPFNSKKDLPPVIDQICEENDQDFKTRKPYIPPTKTIFSTTEITREESFTSTTEEPFPTTDTYLTTEDDGSNKFKSGNIPSKQSDEPYESTSMKPGCNVISIIDQKSLLQTISDKELAKTLKPIVYSQPILAEEYEQFESRIDVLKQLLIDRKIDSNLNLPTNWRADLPPILLNVCEADSTTPIPEEIPEVDDLPRPTLSCTHEKTINPYSVIDVFGNKHHTKFLQKLILSQPILAKDYQQYTTRKGVLHAVLSDRHNDSHSIEFDVRAALNKIHSSPTADLPIEFLEVCKTEIDETTICEEDYLSTESSEDQSESTGLNEDKKMSTEESPTGESTKFRTTNIGTSDQSGPTTSTMNPGQNEPITSSSQSTQAEEFTEDCDETTEVENKSESPKTDLTGESLVKRDDLESTTEPSTTSSEHDCDEPESSHSDSSTVKSVEEDFETDNPKKETDCDDEATSETEHGVTDLPTSPTEDRNDEVDPCNADEMNTKVVKIESLWNALDYDAPRAPYIRNKIRDYTVPIVENKDYTKAEVLRDILQNLRNEEKDSRILNNIEQLIRCIRYEGPGLDAPEVEFVCINKYDLNKATDKPELVCQSNEKKVTVIQTESLFLSLLPSAPKTVYIRNKVSKYLIPIDQNKIYTKGEVLRDILFNLQESITDLRIKHNINVLIKFIRNDGPALEEPDVTDVCLSENDLKENSSTTNFPITTDNPMLEINTPEPVDLSSLKQDEFLTIPDVSPSESFPTTNDMFKTIEVTKPESPSSPIIDSFTSDALVTTTEGVLPNANTECKFSWPLLLKPLLTEFCVDPKGRKTYPVQVVNIRELLKGANGTSSELYVAAALLADVNAHQKLKDFDLNEFHTKREMVMNLVKHLNIELNVLQNSDEPVEITTICNHQLIEALPNTTNRYKRTIFIGKGGEMLRKAIEMAKSHIALHLSHA